MRKIFLFLLSANMTCCAIFAQQVEGTFGLLSEETWLPHQTVRAMYQDSEGNMWIGTNAGLYKYNLYSLTNFNLTKKLSNRLLNNAVHCISEDNSGNILVGTESGLGLLNPRNGDVKVITVNDETISEIIKGKKDIRWFITNSGKVFRLPTDLDSKEKVGIPQLLFDGNNNGAHIVVKTIHQMPDGNLLLGATDGLYKFNTSTNKVTPLGFRDNITSIYAPDYSSVWLGTAENGLYELALSGADLTTVETKFNVRPGHSNDGVNNYITAVNFIATNLLVLATPAKLFLLEKRAGSVSLTEISGNISFKESAIAGLMVDNTSNIWVGSRKGLYKVKRSYLKSDYIPVSVKEYRPDNWLNDLIFIDPDQLWMLTSGAGILRYNRITGRQEKLGFNFKNYRIARKAENGNLIMLADDEVIEIQAKDLAKTNPSYRVLAKGVEWTQVNNFAEIFPGEWWASSWKNGLLRVVASNNIAVSDGFNLAAKQFTDKSHLFDIEKDMHDNVWIGTRGEGLVKIDLKKNQVTRFNKATNFSDRILCIKEDSKGRVWVGTRGDGLHLYLHGSKSFKLFDEKDGLPSNSISAIEENSRGEIWVSTLNGVACMKDDQLVPFQSFDHEDGIGNAEFSFNVSAVDFYGKVYFGSGAGMYRFDKSFGKHIPVSPVVWTNLELLKNDKKTELVNENLTDVLATLLKKNDADRVLVLKHNENSLRIGFASLDFTDPQKNRYAYRLKGKEEEWKIVQGVHQQVQYLNLSPGDYVFEVKAANSEGEWSFQSQSFAIHIKPAFWATTYAYFLYCLLFSLAVIITFFLRKRWFRLNRQLEEEIETGKIHNRQMVFYTDLSHEIKNRLSLLLGPLEQALSGKKVNAQILNNLYEQGLRLKKLTDQIMDIRKSETGGFLLNVAEENIRKLIEQIFNESIPLAVVKNIKMSFTSKKEDITGWCDEELMEIVLMNLVNNAIKYCKTGGAVDMKIDSQYLGENDLPGLSTKEGLYLCCTITDTGLGIEKEEIDKILLPFYRAENARYNKKDTPGTGIGLDLVARLVNKHHGRLDIRSEINEFTAVSFYLPIEKGFYSITELKPDIVHEPIIIPGDRSEYIEGQKLILPSEKLAPLTPGGINEQWHILVVDDNEEMLNLITDSLSDEFTVFKTSNGQQALDLLHQHEIHLIVSDLDMPVMDGLTFCRNIRLTEKYRSIPFLILTGRNSEEQKLICFQNQVDDFIEKPFSPELLKWRVKSFLRNSQNKAKLKTVMVVGPKKEVLESEEDKFIQEIINLIESNIDKEFLDVDFLAENMFTSRATFYRKMEQMVGESPSLFIRKYRLKKAALYLQAGNYSVNQVAAKIGFSNAKYFSKCFQKEFGVLPSEYLRSNLMNNENRRDN